MSAKMKVVALSCFLLLFIENISSQELKQGVYSIDSLVEYTIINSEMCRAIDSVLFYTKDCAYFSALNRPFLICIFLYDSSRFSVEAIPYSCTLIDMFRSDQIKKEEGFCIYKSYTIYIYSRVLNYIHHFFEPTGKKDNVYYNNSENILDHILSAHKNVTIFFEYIDNKIAIEDPYNDISLCSDQYDFLYIVQEGDSWLDVAKKCGCSLEDLTEGWYSKSEAPIPGYLIIVKYRFEDGKVTGIERSQ